VGFLFYRPQAARLAGEGKKKADCSLEGAGLFGLASPPSGISPTLWGGLIPGAVLPFTDRKPQGLLGRERRKPIAAWRVPGFLGLHLPRQGSAPPFGGGLSRVRFFRLPTASRKACWGGKEESRLQPGGCRAFWACISPVRDQPHPLGGAYPGCGSSVYRPQAARLAGEGKKKADCSLEGAGLFGLASPPSGISPTLWGGLIPGAVLPFTDRKPQGLPGRQRRKPNAAWRVPGFLGLHLPRQGSAPPFGGGLSRVRFFRLPTASRKACWGGKEESRLQPGGCRAFWACISPVRDQPHPLGGANPGCGFFVYRPQAARLAGEGKKKADCSLEGAGLFGEARR